MLVVDPTVVADGTPTADRTPDVHPSISANPPGCPVRALFWFNFFWFSLYRFALFQFYILHIPHFWCSLFQFPLLPFALLPWQALFVDSLVVGYRVWMITSCQQNGRHRVGWSGTHMEFMSPTVSDTWMMTIILSVFCISGGHVGLFQGRSCRIWVYWAGLLWGKSGYCICLQGVHGPCLRRKWS